VAALAAARSMLRVVWRVGTARDCLDFHHSEGIEQPALAADSVDHAAVLVIIPFPLQRKRVSGEMVALLRYGDYHGPVSGQALSFSQRLSFPLTARGVPTDRPAVVSYIANVFLRGPAGLR
jgi:hypothetical protein